MAGVLLDLRTGDPILGDNGDYITVEDNYAFYQVITNLFFCQTGSEIWNIYYGFDLEEAVRMNSRGAPTQIITSLVADALDPNKERLIYTVDYIHSERDGQEMNIKFSCSSRLGTIVATEQTIGVG